MSVSTIFFDTSDTLYHSPEFEQAQSKHFMTVLALHLGVSEAKAKEVFKQTKAKLKQTLSHVTKVSVLHEFGIGRLEVLGSLARAMEPDQFLQPNKELNTLLTALSRDYTLGIITNILKQQLFKVLRALAVDVEHFTHIVSSDITSKSKPDHEPFLKALEISGVQPDECVYVGDSLTKDMVPAREAGLRTIWVSRGESPDGAAVDGVIPDILHLEQALRTLV
jgi:HAD superfamily hydrolase (TIGR01549 family)